MYKRHSCRDRECWHSPCQRATLWPPTPSLTHPSLSLLPTVEFCSPSLLSAATSTAFPSQHPLGHNGHCPWGAGLPRGNVGAGGWHCPCRETAGIVVPIINETVWQLLPSLSQGPVQAGSKNIPVLGGCLAVEFIRGQSAKGKGPPQKGDIRGSSTPSCLTASMPPCPR